MSLPDPCLDVHGRLGAVAPAAFAIRPDGYVGFRSEPPGAADLAEHFKVPGLD